MYWSIWFVNADFFDVIAALGGAVPPSATAATFTPGPPPQGNPQVGPGPQSYGGKKNQYTPINKNVKK